MPDSAGLASTYATMWPQGKNKLRCLNFPEELLNSLETLIQKSWPKGIQSHALYADSYEFVLHGSPWGILADKDALNSRVLVRDVLGFLYERGWLLVTCIGNSKDENSKDTMIFRQRIKTGSKSAEAPPPADWMVVASWGSDKLRIVGEEPGLINSLKGALEGLGVYQGGEWKDGSFEFKLKGWPWISHNENRVKAELSMLKILEVLDSYGWRSYGTVRQRTVVGDSWYFVKAQDWVRGSPFNAEAVDPLTLLEHGVAED
jgi:hypothetical protein